MVRPSEGNAEAKEAYDGNIFSVTRQLKYSEDNGKLLDLVFTANYHPENVKV